MRQRMHRACPLLFLSGPGQTFNPFSSGSVFPIPREPPELGGWPFSRQLGVLLECQQVPSCLVLIKRPWIMANDVVGEAHAQLAVDLRINFQAGGEPGCITATVAPPWILAAWSTRTTVQLEPRHLESPPPFIMNRMVHTHIYIYSLSFHRHDHPRLTAGLSSATWRFASELR